MICDFKKDYNKIKKRIIFSEYDYIIIGTGPSATVLYDLLKKKEKNFDFRKRKFQKKNFINLLIQNI